MFLAKAKNLSAVLTFIDFKKAFDSIHRGILMKILRAYGIPDAIVNLIDRMYTDTTARVITADGLTEILKILAGVMRLMQGDTRPKNFENSPSKHLRITIRMTSQNDFQLSGFGRGENFKKVDLHLNTFQKHSRKGGIF